jgi:hypothetical protein
VTLEAEAPDEESSVYAQWGSSAHLLSEMRLKRVLTARGLTQCKGKTIREIAPLLNPDENDFLDIVVDDEMIWVVQEYVLFCESIKPAGAQYAIEEKVQFTDDPQATGTVDFVMTDWPLTLHVVDLKAGAGLQVEAVDNPQLACYGLGALRHFGMDYETIRMTIFQPRGDGDTVRNWELPVKDFVAEWQPRIDEAIERAKTETTTYVSGDHCKWCKGALKCPKMKRNFTSITKVAELTPTPPVNPRTLSKILNAEIPVLEYLNQCKVEAFRLITKGIDVPGFKLVQKYGREKWADETKVTDELDKRNYVDYPVFHSRKPKTPKQLRKILGEDYPSELDKLTVTPNNGAKLVPDTDKRPKFSPAAEVFND